MTILRRATGLLIAAAVGLAAFTPAFAANAPVYREFIQGDAKAKVIVIEYASLTCHFCADFQETGYPKLKAEYIDTGKIKFIYRDFPTDGMAMGAALLTRCAPNDRGKTLVEMMFKNQSTWMKAERPLDVLRGYAQLAGMNSDDVDACLKNEAILKEIQDGQQKAATLYKVQATPTFFVGEEMIKGSDYNSLKKAIDSALK